MSGAIALSGMAALRGGAGLVRLAVPEVCLDTVASFEPSYMTLPLPCDSHGRIAGRARNAIEDAIESATCIACGPGLGQTDSLQDFVEWLYRSVAKPMVLDADSLNLLAKCGEALSRPGGPRILTPHPGEFQRLCQEKNLNTSEAQQRAVELAVKCGVTIVLKGNPTFVTDGARTHLNTTGNPGMATGGTGDVLTGLITALVCQKLTPYDAARLAVYIHGLAGDLAAEELGQVSLIASDLLKYIPAALREVS
jgi:NAD(P)H-hydrate epimerase